MNFKKHEAISTATYKSSKSSHIFFLGLYFLNVEVIRFKLFQMISTV